MNVVEDYDLYIKNRKYYEKLLNKGYFALARAVSKYSEMNPQMGAVIVQKKPISAGFNKLKPAPAFGDIFSTHAEIQALSVARRPLKNCSIYVYRETADGKPAMARPCENCMYRLSLYNVNKVYYTIPHYPFWKMEKIK